jgi:hypothetical protein
VTRVLRELGDPGLDRAEPIAEPIRLAAQRLGQPLHDAVRLAHDPFLDTRNQALDPLLGVTTGRLDPLLNVSAETAGLVHESGDRALSIGQCVGGFVAKASRECHGLAL